VVFGASATDLALITVLVLSGGGFASELYHFYYPAILVYAVAFPPLVTAALTAGAATLYAYVGREVLADAAGLQVLGARLLALGAVAACGYLYWRLERDRRGDAAGSRMTLVRERGRGDREDLFFGQLVMIVARWALVVACTALVLWTVTDEVQLVGAIVPVAALAALNFYLHGRYLLERPANRIMTLAAAAIDLVVITAVVLAWPGPQGLESHFFVLYYPVLMAFAFVFPPTASAVYTAVAVVAYASACLAVDPPLFDDGRALELLVQRLTTLAAVGGLSTYYWRVQRDRRRAALG